MLFVQGMMSIPQQQMMYMPGMPLQPAMTMPAVAGGFVQGHPAGRASPSHIVASWCLTLY